MILRKKKCVKIFTHPKVFSFFFNYFFWKQFFFPDFFLLFCKNYPDTTRVYVQNSQIRIPLSNIEEKESKSTVRSPFFRFTCMDSRARAWLRLVDSNSSSFSWTRRSISWRTLASSSWLNVFLACSRSNATPRSSSAAWSSAFSASARLLAFSRSCAERSLLERPEIVDLNFRHRK